MTALTNHLIRRIKAEGPLTIADYMAEALGNPQHGYYITREPFGASGDFITAPEVSQMFGELIGLWVADYWLKLGSPPQLALIELGPGRGTLMADALRAMKSVPDLLAAIQPHLVEMSPLLRELQKEKLAGGPKPQWHATLDEALSATGGLPFILIANEFFDALPICQLMREPDGWHERLVGLDEGEKFIPQPGPTPSLAAAMLAPQVAAAPVGSIAEICPFGLRLVGDMAVALKSQGGAALIIDYGTVTSLPGDSLQAMAGHKFVDVFENPGTADITAHVDFAALVRAAQGVRASGPIGQGRFLENLGIHARGLNLKRRANEVQAQDIDLAIKRLCHKDDMGDLFKVLCLSPVDGPTPAGFEGPT